MFIITGNASKHEFENRPVKVTIERSAHFIARASTG